MKPPLILFEEWEQVLWSLTQAAVFPGQVLQFAATRETVEARTRHKEEIFIVKMS